MRVDRFGGPGAFLNGCAFEIRSLPQELALAIYFALPRSEFLLQAGQFLVRQQLFVPQLFPFASKGCSLGTNR